MFIRLALLFTLIPLIELALLIWIGQHIGVLSTIAIVALTGIIGAALAKSQGFMVLNRLRNALMVGEMPGDYLLEGAMILVGGAMLLTPGLLTDAAGFVLIIPHSRVRLREVVREWLKNWLIVRGDDRRS